MQPQANYDFILNPQQSPQQPRFSGGGNQSMAMRVLIVVGGLFALIIAAFIFMSLVSGGGNKDALLSAAQDQTELLRIAEGAKQNAKLETTKDFTMTLKLTIKSQQAELLAYMSQSNIKVDQKKLILKQSAQTDQRLATAISTNTYDTTYKSVMNDAIKVYQADLSAAYEASGETGKPLLRGHYEATELLLEQLNADH